MAKNQSVKSGKKLRGAVLIMVLTVMFMLIILLLATLTVVSTAQNRSYSKFEENQAYYSARSALDVYIGNMLADQTFAAVDDTGTRISHQKMDNSGALDKFTQGYAMELDLYKIKAHADTYDNYLAMPDKTQFSTDHWVNPNNVFTAEPLKTDYDDASVDFIEYTVTYPTISNSATDKHGKFIDNNSTATIKVEVLARTFGGHDPAAADGDATDIASIVAESRSKDTMTIKVTSTATYGEYTATAIALFDTVDNPSYFQDALTCFGALPGTNNTSVIGGLSALDPFTFRNDGVVYGGMYSKQSTFFDAHEYIFIDKEDSVYLKDYTFDESAAFYPHGYDGTDPDEVPVVYIDGQCIYNGSVDGEIGDTSVMTDPSKSVYAIINGDYSTLVGSNIFKVNGDLIITGDLDLNGMEFEISGSLIVLGDLTVTNNRWNNSSMVSGGIFVGGSTDIQALGSGGAPNFLANLYTNGNVTYLRNNLGTDTVTNVTGWNAVNFAGGVSSFTDIAKCVDLNQITTETAEGKAINLIRVNSLSGNVSGTGSGTLSKGIERYVDTESSRFCNYLKADGTVISAEEWAGTPSENDRKAGNFTPLNFSAPPAGAQVITGSTLTVSGKQDFILNSSMSNLTITGSGTANIYVSGVNIPDNVVVGTSATDRPKVNFLMPSGTYSNNNARIWTYAIAGMYGANADLKFGEGGNVKSPTLRFYLSSGATWNFANNSLVTGYIYGPGAAVNFSMGVSSNGDYYFNNTACERGGSNIRSIYQAGIIGACVAKDVSSQNNMLYCYVKDDNEKDAGIPQLEWQAAEYRAY